MFSYILKIRDELGHGGYRMKLKYYSNFGLTGNKQLFKIFANSFAPQIIPECQALCFSVGAPALNRTFPDPQQSSLPYLTAIS